jgi:SAM-dependent methyltransferase
MRPLASPLVQPIDEPFQAVLDDLARRRGWPTSADHARLGARVRRLSDAYNDPASVASPSDELLSARLVFSFPRDVPKGAGAVRELCALGLLAPTPRATALHVLDVGAGLGATARGVIRALGATGATGTVVVDSLDSDAAALELALAIARARPREAGLAIELRPMCAPAVGTNVRGPYDLILLGQVLSELDRGGSSGAEARVAQQAALLWSYAGALDESGSLVIVEPALRDRTRHLHALRDALLQGGPPLHVVAPCLHDDRCPALATEEPWCHEDLDVDLPAWLVPVARAAGLRWQGLTFSYLVLRKDERVPLRGSGRALRVVSGPVVSKGKRELFLCGRFDGVAPAQRLKVTRLDRHAAPASSAWDAAARGDILELTPAVPPGRPRVEAGTTVTLATPVGGREAGPVPA